MVSCHFATSVRGMEIENCLSMSVFVMQISQFQTEICSSSLTEIIQGVVNGADGCLFSYGYSRQGLCALQRTFSTELRSSCGI